MEPLLLEEYLSNFEEKLAPIPITIALDWRKPFELMYDTSDISIWFFFWVAKIQGTPCHPLC